VQQEAAHELVGAGHHRLAASLALGAVVLPAEGHAALVQAEQTDDLQADDLACAKARAVGQRQRGIPSTRLRNEERLPRERLNPLADPGQTGDARYRRFKFQSSHQISEARQALRRQPHVASGGDRG